MQETKSQVSQYAVIRPQLRWWCQASSTKDGWQGQASDQLKKMSNEGLGTKKKQQKNKVYAIQDS